MCDCGFTGRYDDATEESRAKFISCPECPRSSPIEPVEVVPALELEQARENARVIMDEQLRIMAAYERARAELEQAREALREVQAELSHGLTANLEYVHKVVDEALAPGAVAGGRQHE